MVEKISQSKFRLKFDPKSGFCVISQYYSYDLSDIAHTDCLFKFVPFLILLFRLDHSFVDLFFMDERHLFWCSIVDILYQDMSDMLSSY